LLNCVVACDGPLVCCMPLDMRGTARGTHWEDTPRRNRPLIRLCPRVIDHKDGARACCLQQRAASAAPLDQAARVCLLMHVGVAQASSRMYLERPVRPLVSTVEQVSVGCCRRGISCPLIQSSLCAYFGGGCSTRIRSLWCTVPNSSGQLVQHR
jgi:hypothetical protein